MKPLHITSADEAEIYEHLITSAAEKVRINITNLIELSPIEFLAKLKFEMSGFDPLNPERELNLIEQLNQTFTYIASLRGACQLFEWLPELRYLTLNLGTQRGWDIESDDCGGINCEVFAATSPKSNQKLDRDIERLTHSTANHRYVFFMCPNIQPGWYVRSQHHDVKVWSLNNVE